MRFKQLRYICSEGHRYVRLSCRVGAARQFIDIKTKKTDFIKKPIQSIFLLTKKRGKKLGKYLNSYSSVPWLISDVCKSENKTEILVLIRNRNGRYIFYGYHYFPSSKLILRHFRKMEEVLKMLNGYVTNPNPTPILTPNPNLNPNSNPNRINNKNPKRKTLEN